MEIEIVKKVDKSIIVVEPITTERISTIVKINADIISKWNTNFLVSDIRELCN